MARGSPTRRGVAMIAIIMVLMIAFSIGAIASFMTRSAGRSTQWFHQTAMAQELANSALKVILAQLQTEGMKSVTAGESSMVSPFIALLRSDQPPIGKSIPVLSSEDTTKWPDELKAEIARYAPASARIQVSLRVLSMEPAAKVHSGFTPDPREHQGWIQVCSRAWSPSLGGRRIGRTIVLERRFRTVSVRLPLLGRFALFIGTGNLDDPNIVRMNYADGDARLAPDSPGPLEITSAAYGTQVVSGRHLETKGTAELPADFLDRQGWEYLGPRRASSRSGAGEPWTLRLGHGFSGAGEAPLLATLPTVVRTGDKEIEELSALRPAGSLFRVEHGFAANTTGVPETPASTAQSSILRLFGGPTSFSPTLVFGPVNRSYVQEILARDSGSRSPLRTLKSRVIADAFNLSLEQAIGAAVSGEFGKDGLLEPGPEPAHGSRIRVSRLLEHLAAVKMGSGKQRMPLPESLLAQAYNGDLRVPGLFQGNLQTGLAAFDAVLRGKVVYQLKPDKLDVVIQNGRLRLPGILYVPPLPKSAGTEPQALELGDIEVEQGGILVCGGSVRLNGNVRGGKDGALAIVCREGDIILGSRVSHIDAYLVSIRGKTIWSPNPIEIRGGLASRELDLASLRHPATRRIVYTGDHDPLGEGVSGSYKVLFGGEDKYAVLGAEEL